MISDRRIAAVCFLALIHLASCTSDGDAGCQAGSTKCQSPETMAVCTADGSAWAVQDCPTGTTCLASACEAIRCPQTACGDGEVCDNDGRCIVRACNQGDQRCNSYSSQIETCKVDGSGWETPTNCPDGQACEEGSCRDVVCVPGEDSCSEDGRTLNTCRKYGTGSTIAACQTDFVCENAMCRPVMCEPMQVRCRKDLRAVERCLDRGTAWMDESVCPEDQACNEDACAQVVCDASSWTCSDDFRTRWQCNESGTVALAPVACAQNEACFDGDCMPLICQPGSSACQADFTGLIVCDPTGTLTYPGTTCNLADVCVAGQCVPATSVLREVLTLTGAQGSVPLSPGLYAVAVVDVDEREATFEFPLTIMGDVGDALPAMQPAASKQVQPTSPAVPPWRCGTPMASRFLPQVRPLARLAAVPLPSNEVVGDTRLFQVMSENEYYPLERTGLLRIQGKYANFWEDTTDGSPGGDLSQATLEDIGDRLDKGVFARDVALFGEPTDVDGNGRIDVLFTSLLPTQSAAAFVWPVTLFPPGSAPFQTDHGEVIYSMPPGGLYSTAIMAGIIAHETAHLLVIGQRIKPWLDNLDQMPAWVTGGGVYLGEGLAELGHAWSGQSQAQSTYEALASPWLWSLGALFQDDYYAGDQLSRVHYGLGTLAVGYLFLQAGGVDVTGPSTIEDRGGIPYLSEVVSREHGFPRIAPLDGRLPEEWYTDLAASLLLTSLPNGPGPLAGANPLFKFPSAQRDPWFGGSDGLMLSIDGSASVVRQPWSGRPAAMNAGGASFLTVFVAGEATIAVQRETSSAILVRYKP